MTLDDLAAYGANVDEGLARCMGNEELYERLVNSVKDDKNFDALEAALDEGDLEAAFAASHALKGVLGNLSITPLYEPMSEICEVLRNGAQADYSELRATIAAQKKAFFAL